MTREKRGKIPWQIITDFSSYSNPQSTLASQKIYIEMSAEDKKETATKSANNEIDPNEIIDQEIFDQIMEMDEDENREFSKEIIEKYYVQAEDTFKDIAEEIKKNDLEKLSKLGHFLKGSSAALGFKKVQASCANIEQYGLLKNDDNTPIEPDEALKMIEDKFKQMKEDYKKTETYLKSLYGSSSKE